VNLIRLAEAGDTAGVLRELGTLTPAQRAAHAGALAARAEAMAAARDEYTDEQRAAQRLAELGCQVSPEAAADWLLRNEPRALGRHAEIPGEPPSGPASHGRADRTAPWAGFGAGQGLSRGVRTIGNCL